MHITLFIYSDSDAEAIQITRSKMHVNTWQLMSDIFYISDDGTTHFIHSFEQGLMAAMKPDDDTTFYYEFNGDG